MNNIDHNYLSRQYEITNELPINHNYLKQQAKNTEKIFQIYPINIKKTQIREDLKIIYY